MTHETSVLVGGGMYLDLLNPDPACFTLENIARGLSNTCRFAGQPKRFYSVAEHCVWVSYLVPRLLALRALMHDASEAFLCDIVTPLKLLLPEYMVIEARVQRAICLKYDIPPEMTWEIEAADAHMLTVEMKQVMGNDMEFGPTHHYYTKGDINVVMLDPDFAYEAFIQRANELGITQ
jgi:uncharacterized protein